MPSTDFEQCPNERRFAQRDGTSITDPSKQMRSTRRASRLRKAYARRGKFRHRDGATIGVDG
jgi:hypothetical protein